MIISKKIQIQISRAVTLLKKEHPVAFPTDTVYGLGADPRSDLAIKSVFILKNRSFTQALPILLSSMEEVSRWVDFSNLKTNKLYDLFIKLTHDFWPGPLTIVLKKHNGVSSLLTANTNNIAVRIPNHPIALNLLQQFGSAIIGTSANKSRMNSAINAAQVRTAFGKDLMVIDNDDSSSGSLRQESTIISLIDQPNIIRCGAIKVEQLSKYFNN